MNKLTTDRLLELLIIAVNEAEGWFDEARGNTKRLAELRECYKAIEAAGLRERLKKDRV